MVLRLFYFLSAASLVLMLATCVLWIRSYGDRDAVEFGHNPRWEIASSGGQFWLADDPEQRRKRFEADEAVESALVEIRRTDDVLAKLRTCIPNSHHDHAVFCAQLSRSDERQVSLRIQHLQARFLLQQTPAVASGIRHVSHGVLVVILTTFPFVSLALAYRQKLRRRKWRMSSRCEACGYDLRATPHGCPECGHVASVTCTDGP